MKAILTFLMIVLVSTHLYSNDRIQKFIQNDVVENGQIIPYQWNKTPGAPFTGDGQYPGAVDITMGFFDYGTNGQNLTNIYVFQDTVILAWFSADSTDPTGGTSRVAYYAFSSNGGTSWNGPFSVQALPNRSAYPEIQPFFDAMGRNIAMNGRKYNPGSGGGAWTEAFFGLGSFTGANMPNGGSDLFGAVINNDEVGGIYNQANGGVDELKFIKYNIISSTFDPETIIVPAGQNTSTNVRYKMESSTSGNDLVAMWWDSPDGAQKMVYITSSDAGATWSSQNIVQQSRVTNSVINGDTCGPWFGMDAAFKPNTSEFGLAWSTLYPISGSGLSSGDPQGTKILYYSPGINGGVPVEVAGKVNMTIISDTNNFFNVQALQVGVTPVSHPSIGWSDDGSRIACFFSGFQPGDSLDGFNFNDIYYTYSDDNGLTWATPENLTNTPDWDELYPTVSLTGNTSNLFHVKYHATRGPGSQSFTDNAPVYRVYQVYQKVAITSINNISSEIPEKFDLKQNFPNPFNPETKIRFDITKASNVSLKVYDSMGREIATLINNQTAPVGTNEVTFNASNLSSGVYFYTLSSGDFKMTKKMLLMK
ncbi:MAG: T9SS type A sorting domain-containing protein [Ignavibacteriaceae bacterium]|nr:T9SS type A sorting domain-containing protein [Ignavibacteriaceae bacterium]